MAEYIDREAMLEQIARRESLMVGDKMISIDALREFIMNRPVVDVEHVIRCRDCKYSRELNHEDPKERQFIEGCVWCMNWEYGVFPDDYCSNAKRREDENNGTHQ